VNAQGLVVVFGPQSLNDVIEPPDVIRFAPKLDTALCLGWVLRVGQTIVISLQIYFGNVYLYRYSVFPSDKS
jgi:hypothetical protein